MKTSLALMCGMLMMSSVVFAEDTVETCANGAGEVITGAVTGYKSCKSNQRMNWWNAVSWCDALKRPLFDLDDCGCDWSTNCNGTCPELAKVAGYQFLWMITPASDSRAYFVNPLFGSVASQNRSDYSWSNYSAFALCK